MAKGMGGMMKQAQKLQAKMAKVQEELGAKQVEGDAGGGMVVATANGHQEILSIKIDPEVVSADDVEMLQDLIVAAIAEAQRRADDIMSQQMGGMMGGLNIPGLT